MRRVRDRGRVPARPSVSPLHRVQEILIRLKQHPNDVETLKTCCGALAILSRDEPNKLMIVRDGLRLILSTMSAHSRCTDLLESACDLLWSLAFNNDVVKEVIGRQGGIQVVLATMNKHNRSTDLLKSACGTLSNLCQIRDNQSTIGREGGVQTLLNILMAHSNAMLLPFVFDALASLIVGHQTNSLAVFRAGAIPIILRCLQQNITRGELLKSGCHALAILSDIEGHGGAIAEAGGIKVLAEALGNHPKHVELQRVSAVVLLRMLHEAPVAAELAAAGGIPLMLRVVETQRSEVETAAAACHILYSISDCTVRSTNGHTLLLGKKDTPGGGAELKHTKLPAGRALDVSGLVIALKTHTRRLDLVRAACRTLANLVECTSSCRGADDSGIDGSRQAGKSVPTLRGADDMLAQMLHVSMLHPNVVDVLECTAAVALSTALTAADAKDKTQSRTPRLLVNPTAVSLAPGLLLCLRTQPHSPVLRQAVLSTIASFYPDKQAQSPKDKGKLGSSLPERIEKQTAELAMGHLRQALENIKELDDIEKLRKDGIFCESNTVTEETSGSASSVDPVGDVVCCCHLFLKVAAEERGWSLLQQVGVGEVISPLRQLLRDLHDAGNSHQAQKQPSRVASLCSHVQQLLRIFGTNDADADGDDDTHANAEARPKVNGNGIVADDRIASQHSKGSSATGAAFISDASSTATSSSTGNKNESGDSKSATHNVFCAADGSPVHPLGAAAAALRSSGRVPLGAGPDGVLLAWSPSKPEPCATPRQGLVQMMTLEDKQRAVSRAQGIMGARIVYDAPAVPWRGVPSRVPAPYPYDVTPAMSQAWATAASQRRQSKPLSFCSNFESGNLLRAVQIGPEEYDLVLRADVHTGGYIQWFYFAVSNTHRPGEDASQCSRRFRFNIVNLAKPDSSFNQGMRPVLYSCRDAHESGRGWVRCGSDICYFQNTYQKPGASKSSDTYYTLSFYVTFPHGRDTFLLAHTYPYTTIDNRHHIDGLLATPSAAKYVRRSVMCHSLAGNECDLLTISDWTSAEEEERRTGSAPRRRAICLSARVHPGECQASWMMRGLIDYLCGQSRTAHILRNTFVFKIVPMLNLDGVMLGNNRCSLAAVDLNRQWKRPSRAEHPTVYCTKAMIREEHTERTVALYCDLHGHSRKKNVFMYGCDDRKKPRPTVRVFPKLLSWTPHGRHYVSFHDCAFQVRRGRESTARVVVARDVGIPNSYTLEATYCGPDFGQYENTHLCIAQLMEVGEAFCEALLDYYVPDPAQRDKVDKVIREVESNTGTPGESKTGDDGDDVGSDCGDDDDDSRAAVAGAGVCTSNGNDDETPIQPPRRERRPEGESKSKARRRNKKAEAGRSNSGSSTPEPRTEQSNVMATKASASTGSKGIFASRARAAEAGAATAKREIVNRRGRVIGGRGGVRATPSSGRSLVPFSQARNARSALAAATAAIESAGAPSAAPLRIGRTGAKRGGKKEARTSNGSTSAVAETFGILRSARDRDDKSGGKSAKKGTQKVAKWAKKGQQKMVVDQRLRQRSAQMQQQPPASSRFPGVNVGSSGAVVRAGGALPLVAAVRDDGAAWERLDAHARAAAMRGTTRTVKSAPLEAVVHTGYA